MSALATVETHRSALVARPVISREILVAEAEQRKILAEYVNSQMVEGTDYGVIPGTNKPTLYKPGAEKLTTLFHCAPRFTIIEKVEDFEKGFFYYQFKCEIESLQTAGVVAEGYGSCSSMESKYRYRNDERKCPSCQKPTIRKSKFAPRDNPNDPPGFYCHEKAGGCGANFGFDDTAITEQIVGKIENPDRADTANTVLKMAKKRAHVDGAVTLARCSDMFTQDAEDFADQGSNAAPTNGQAGKSASKGAEKPPVIDPKLSFELTAKMIEAIHSDAFTADQAALWKSMAKDYETKLTATDKKRVESEWKLRRESTTDPKKSATLRDTIIASIQAAGTLTDLDATGLVLRSNEGKLTDDDRKAVVEAGKLKRDIIQQEAAVRAEHGPGSTEP